MADLKSMTVRALRELARKHVGPGYSRLKTKSDLVRALSEVLPASITEALEPEPLAASANPTRAPREEAARSRAGDTVTDSKKKTDSKKPPAEEKKKTPTPPATDARVAADKSPATASTGAAAAAPPAPAAATKKSPSAAGATRVAEPAEETPEALEAEETPGEEEAEEVALKAQAATDEEKPAAEAKEQPAAAAKTEWVDPPAAREAKYWDGQLGELPDSYGEDTVVLLPKDPWTVMAFWDFTHETRARAFSDLEWPHARIRLYDEEYGVVREVEFALEARRWYLFNITPGRRYRVELVAASPTGETRRIGPPSNAIQVPPKGPSPVVDDRFIRIPWDTPPRRLPDALGQHAWPSWSEARAGEPAPAPVEAETQRSELYRLSGGATLGSSEQMANWAAGGEQRGGTSAGGRYSGKWPWSGILPERAKPPTS